jgi:hypothetical protein
MKRGIKRFLSSNVFNFIGTGGGMGASYYSGPPGSAGFSSPVSTYASLIVVHNPLVYWEMNDAAAAEGASAVVGGEAFYASVQNEASAGYSTMVSSMSDTSWNFDGVNDRLEVLHPNIGELLEGSTALTLEMWAEMDVLNANDAVFVHYVGATQFGLGLNSATTANQLRFTARSRVNDLAQFITYTVPASALNRPLHLVCVANFPTDKMWMYVDGKLAIASTSKSFGLGAYAYVSTNPTGNDYIGGQPASNRWWNGRAGHIAIYGEALTSSRVFQHYQWGKGDLP